MWRRLEWVIAEKRNREKMKEEKPERRGRGGQKRK